ncbi:hypothetical protein PPERSA_08702 [Pseudocohnilembus persalinus]|uniref:histidine--tRNA ligase n=1 Tax=Pseudocohnilembus persalinus TaxID=266149 RepID=A0A0V0R8A3_PSEPJ|nr:hypothetical protein PPERSA_08702 [Pseudocohnilembus persalinus]|eukprot:KRX10707.1 hypothetical protein PPERSA_08702 [Pseudocohnilembus persalinus]
MANQNNYEEVFLNQLESIEVFKRTLGDQSDIVKKEMFSLQDLGGNTLVLRPEGTASLMRFILNNKLQFNLPKKYFYYGPMYRYERPQKGRYRQFYQFGVENLGSNDPLADFEIVNMANQIMQKIYKKNEHFELEINTLGDLEAQNFYNLELQKFFKQKYIYDQLSEDSKQRLERNNALRILDSKNQKDIELSEKAPKIQQFLSQSSQENYQEIKQMLQISGINYTENFRLVRGLDYYNDLCFEFKDKSQGGKSQNTLLAGGRYDRLSSILSQNQTNISAVGWAAGIDRMSEKLMELVEINNLSQKKVIKIGFVPIIQGKDISSEDKNIIRTNLLKKIFQDPCIKKQARY